MPRLKIVQIQRRIPKQGRASVTVGTILDAAARIIRQGGLTGLTTNRIAEVAGVSIGSLYDYFPDKSAILLALAERFLAGDAAALLTALEGVAPAELVRALVRALIRRHGDDDKVRRVVMAHHIGMGLGARLGEHTEALVGEIAARLADRLALHPTRLFVVTRAVVGVCRAPLEEPNGHAPPPAVMEDELVRLVYAYLGEDAAPLRS